MSPQHQPVGSFMTPLPHTIGVEQSLAAASERMQQLGVRHLPVLDDGSLIGVISARDVSLLRSVKSIDPERTSLEDALTAEPYLVGPEMPLGAVARTMAERKIGSAIVVEDHRVVGILTTTDALAILANLMEGTTSAGDEPSPSEVRQRILDEHAVLRTMLTNVSDLADRALNADAEAAEQLPEQARELYRTLICHLDLEDLILGPALRDSGAFGLVRAEGMATEHEKQRHQLKAALLALEIGGAQRLAESIQVLVPYVLKDMDAEESQLLSKDVLSDVPESSGFIG